LRHLPPRPDLCVIGRDAEDADEKYADKQDDEQKSLTALGG
jgi:hypothetical protein